MMTLDFEEIGLTPAEGQILMTSILVKLGRGTGMEEGEFQRQYDALEAWINQVKCDVVSINLILNGAIHPSVDADGNIKFVAASDAGIRAMQRALAVIGQGE